MVAMSHCCAPRPWGLDLFHRARTVLTGMVDIRHSILIFHGDMRFHRHHFRDAWHQARDDPDAVFLTYDANHPDAVLKDLQQRYQRPLREPSTTAKPSPRYPTYPTQKNLWKSVESVWVRRPRPAERHPITLRPAPQRWSEPPPLAA